MAVWVDGHVVEGKHIEWQSGVPAVDFQGQMIVAELFCDGFRRLCVLNTIVKVIETKDVAVAWRASLTHVLGVQCFRAAHCTFAAGCICYARLGGRRSSSSETGGLSFRGCGLFRS